MNSRRKFIKASGILSGSLFLSDVINSASLPFDFATRKIPLYAHLWVYASKYPPDWDCTPILDEVFSDLKFAGLQGVELMEVILRRSGSVERLKGLVEKFSLPVVGTSYNGNMWMKSKHSEILEDIELVTERLHAVGGTMLGISVGDARHKKTEEELDAQGDILKKIMQVCNKNQIRPNLHNHTYEMVNEMHDFKGIITRVPELQLGPDLNWLVRAGIDPVWFIKTYGHKMAYMHIRDQRADGKWTEAVGEGVMNFPAIAKALKKINYKGKAAIELAFDTPVVRPVRTDWKLSRDYVKKVFGW
jgi:sugar phosphate isomerase/epimerase